MTLKTFARFSLVAALPVIFALGCGQEAAKTMPDKGHTHADGTAHQDEKTDGAGGHNHSGWWCTEHGVPEGECGQCDPKLAAEFQKNNDWCKQHDRPDSQCFVCHPEKEALFAAKYEAKFGKQPPKAN